MQWYKEASQNGGFNVPNGSFLYLEVLYPKSSKSLDNFSSETYGFGCSFILRNPPWNRGCWEQVWMWTKIWTGWWFGCHEFYMFPLILGMSIHPNWRTHIFQRGGPTTNQICFVLCYDTMYPCNQSVVGEILRYLKKNIVVCLSIPLASNFYVLGWLETRGNTMKKLRPSPFHSGCGLAKTSVSCA